MNGLDEPGEPSNDTPYTPMLKYFCEAHEATGG